MQQLPEQAQKIIDEFKEKFQTLSPEKQEVMMKKMTEIITAMNQDMKGMIGVLQTAKDKRELEALKQKMQENN